MEQTGNAGGADVRKTMKIDPEAKRLWDTVAAASGMSRDDALIKYGAEVLKALRSEGKLP